MKRDTLVENLVVFILIVVSTFIFVIISFYKSSAVYSFSDGEIKDKTYFTAAIPDYTYKPHFLHHVKNNHFTENVEFLHFVKEYTENYQSYIDFYNNFNCGFTYYKNFNNPVIKINSNDLTYIYKSQYELLLKVLKERPKFLLIGDINTLHIYKNNNLIITLKDDNFENGTVKIFIPADKLNTEKLFNKFKPSDEISLIGYIDTDKTSMSDIKFYCSEVIK